MSKLIINDLYVNVEDKPILKGINLELNTNEIHALMGPNGNGKSTLLNTIMGHPKYTVIKGEILLDDINILELTVDERAKKGLFIAMQYPLEIPGVTNADFLKTAINVRTEKPISLYQFIKRMENAISDLEMDSKLAHRYLNEGFSGGEKKRNEILQMKLLKPKIALLDEIDSGLDVDALRIVSKAINEMVSSDFGALIVSHYERFYTMVKPTHVHILVDGKIVKSGDYSLVEKIDIEGYAWLKQELGIEIKEKEEEVSTINSVTLGSCAIKEKASNE